MILRYYFSQQINEPSYPTLKAQEAKVPLLQPLLAKTMIYGPFVISQ